MPRVLLNSRHSGTVIAAGIAITILVLVVAGYAAGLGWVGSWRLFGVPSMLPAFLDLHGVTDNVACAARGIDVYVVRNCDVLTRSYNYPPIWLLLGKLGIGGDDTPWLALLVEVPALALFVLLLRGRSVGMGLLALLAILSPSVMLAFERGNIDLVEWSLMCGAALLFSERRISRIAASLALLIAAVILKLIAVFCCAAIIRLRRPEIILSGILLAFSLLYFYSIADVLPMIRQNTDYTEIQSYGYIILFAVIEFAVAPLLGIDLKGLIDSSVPTATVILVTLGAILLALVLVRRGHRFCKITDDTGGTAFLFGGGIFLGSFLLLGTSYAYRLTFLLLCLPLLFDWIERRGAAAGQLPGASGTSDRNSRRIAWLLFGSSLVSMWLKFVPIGVVLQFLEPYAFEMKLIDQTTDWILFGTLTVIFSANGFYAWCAARSNPAAMFSRITGNGRA